MRNNREILLAWEIGPEGIVPKLMRPWSKAVRTAAQFIALASPDDAVQVQGFNLGDMTLADIVLFDMLEVIGEERRTTGGGRCNLGLADLIGLDDNPFPPVCRTIIKITIC